MCNDQTPGVYRFVYTAVYRKNIYSLSAFLLHLTVHARCTGPLELGPKFPSSNSLSLVPTLSFKVQLSDLSRVIAIKFLYTITDYVFYMKYIIYMYILLTFDELTCLERRVKDLHGA